MRCKMRDYVGKVVRQKRPKGKYGECRDTAKITLVKNGVKHVYSLGRWGSPEAEQAYNKLMVQYYSNSLEVNTDHRILSDYFRSYMLSLQDEPLTYVKKSYIKKVIAWGMELVGSLPCSKLSFSTLTLFKDKILQEAKKNNWTSLHANKILYMCKHILLQGVINGWFDPSLLPIIKSYPPIKERLKTLRTRTAVSDDVVNTTLKYMRQPYADMVRLIRSACLRPSELLRLRKKDIVVKKGCWVVNIKSKTERYGYERIIVFTPNEQAILKKWIQKDSDILFKTRFGGPCSYYSLKEAIKMGIKRANEAGEHVPYWTSYQLRHAAFTENVKKYGVEVASKLAGHSNLNMARIYDHSTESILIDLAQKRSNNSNVD